MFRTMVVGFLTLGCAALRVGDTFAAAPRITGEIRARTEADLHRGVPPVWAGDDTLNSRSLLRTRIDLELAKDSLTRLFVQLQDARIYGHDPGTSGGLANDMNLGIRQAYLEARHWIWQRLNIRVGRQEWSYGNQRLIGPVGWNNVGRSFDGALGAVAFEAVTLEAGAATLLERDPPDGTAGTDSDQMIGLLALRFPKRQFELLLILDLDLRRPDAARPDDRRLARATLAAYSARRFAQRFDYVANLALQGGTTNEGAGSRDIEAYLFALEAGVTTPGKARFALGLDLASGDDGSDPGTRREFNNLYYTGHAFRGHLDNFIGPVGPVATAGRGLRDLYLRAAFDLSRHWRAGADLHAFATAEAYPSRIDGLSRRDIGTELDLWVKAAEYRGLTWDYGMSFFFWSEDFVGLRRETTQFWAFSQLTLNVK